MNKKERLFGFVLLMACITLGRAALGLAPFSDQHIVIGISCAIGAMIAGFIGVATVTAHAVDSYRDVKEHLNDLSYRLINQVAVVVVAICLVASLLIDLDHVRVTFNSQIIFVEAVLLKLVFHAVAVWLAINTAVYYHERRKS